MPVEETERSVDPGEEAPVDKGLETRSKWTESGPPSNCWFREQPAPQLPRAGWEDPLHGYEIIEGRDG